MKKIIITAIALLAILMQVTGSASAQGEELVTNGDFETPIVPSGLWNIYPSGSPDVGWSVEWYDGSDSFGGMTRPEIANLELHRPNGLWPVYSGSQYAELDSDWDGPSGTMLGEPASVRIFQVIKTCEGGEYELKYAWSPRINHADNAVEVWWGDEMIASHSGPGGASTSWTPETIALTSSSDSTVLAFVETGTPDSYGMFLDGVSLVQTNECPVKPKIDIKPGKYPNVIHIKTAKYIPVAVLGSADFDVNQIDISSLLFAGLHVRGLNNVPKCWVADVSGDFTSPSGAPDGFDDLTCQFAFDLRAFSPNDDGTATLTGNLLDGTPFSGTDSITIRP
jgi:hypothetical protein